VSFQKDSLLLVSIALEKKKTKEVIAQSIALKTIVDKLKTAENKKAKEVYRLGVKDQKTKRIRRKYFKKKTFQKKGINILISPSKLFLIYDYKEELIIKKTEDIKIYF
jgi:hypothetical protein